MKGDDNIYIAQVSGGKDSFTMLDRLLSDESNISDAVCCDTGYEFDTMYDFWDKMYNYFYEKYSFKITFLGRDGTGKARFDRMMFGKFKNTPRLSDWKIDRYRGYPQSNTPCFGHRECKIYQTRDFIKRKYPKQYKSRKIKFYIGIAADEPHRIRNDKNLLYPLVKYGLSENDCLQHNAGLNMRNPLYDHFDRTGCIHCPKQTKAKFLTIKNNFPEDWSRLVRLDRKIINLNAYNTQVRHGLYLSEL